MRSLVVVSALILFIAACHGHGGGKKDGIDTGVAIPPYAPGLGEFMLGIQSHHIKLYYAGKAGNWQLAAFELKEISEARGDIEKYCADRPEVKSLSMLQPGMDSVQATINGQNTVRFKKAYSLLTAECNSCHRSTKHAFNVVKIPNPKANPYVDQDFSKMVETDEQ